MKRYSLIVMLFVALAGRAQGVIDEVIWVVGDEAILRSEVEEERLRAQYEGQQIKGDPYCVIPEQMAVQKLFLHQALIDSVEANESSVSHQVDELLHQPDRIEREDGGVFPQAEQRDPGGDDDDRSQPDDHSADAAEVDL